MHTLETLAWVDFAHVKNFFTTDRALAMLRAVVVMGLALVTTPLVRRAVVRLLGPRLGLQQTMLVRRAATYLMLGLACTWALRELGFELSILIGAAGALTVALGIASQTPVANMISGLFLIGEQPFGVGDLISVDTLNGEILSIDLLSVKLRTFDNLYVRIPNEMLVKTMVTNLTRFPIRRCDLQINVAYEADMDHVRRVLDGVADRNPLCLEDPKPLFIFLGFGESSQRLQYSMWSKRQNYLELKNSAYTDIKAAFARENISPPILQRGLGSGPGDRPVLVQMMGAGAAPEPRAGDAPAQADKGAGSTWRT